MCALESGGMGMVTRAAMSRAAAIFLLAASTPAISGCVAAIIPLYAGAALVKTTATPDTSSPPAEAKPGPVAANAAVASERSDVKIVPTSLTSLPPPGQLATGTANPVVAKFQTYALAQAELPPGTGKRVSAIVSDAADLRLMRRPCTLQPAAVFVDLDPGRGTFDPLAPGRADPSLGPALTALRGRGVEVVWFSRLGDSFVSAARTALADGGLDAAGRDEIVLMRDLDERKQTRRDDVARRFCPIAILGDERADFDELYLYLKNADAALALDGMLGKGWFMAAPFALPSRSDAGAAP